MGLKVKELRDYLHLHDIPTHTCREKEELVELVLDQNTPSSSSNSSSSSSSSNGCSNSAPQPAAPDVSQSNTRPSQVPEEPESLTEEEEEEGEDDDEEEEDEEVKALIKRAFIVLLTRRRFRCVSKVGYQIEDILLETIRSIKPKKFKWIKHTAGHSRINKNRFQ